MITTTITVITVATHTYTAAAATTLNGEQYKDDDEHEDDDADAGHHNGDDGHGDGATILIFPSRKAAVSETLARSRGRQRLETNDNLPKLCKSFFATLVADDPSPLLQRHYYAAEAA